MDPTEANPQEVNDLIESIRTELALRKARLGDRASPARSNRQTYAWGSELVFARQGNAVDYVLSGWSDPEETHWWTVGDLAEIELPVEEVDCDLMLEVDGYAFQPDAKAPQRVGIRVNGTLCAEWMVAGPDRHHALILRARLRHAGIIRLSFELPDAISPAEGGLVDDQRKLGMAFHRLTLRPLDT